MKKERIQREYRENIGIQIGGGETSLHVLASPHLSTPSACTCMPSLLKQPIIVVLIRAVFTGGRGRVLLWRVARWWRWFGSEVEGEGWLVGWLGWGAGLIWALQLVKSETWWAQIHASPYCTYTHGRGKCSAQRRRMLLMFKHVHNVCVSLLHPLLDSIPVFTRWEVELDPAKVTSLSCTIRLLTQHFLWWDN